MTATRSSLGARPPVVAIVVYTLRSSLPGRRWIGALVPCVVAVLFGVLVQSLDGTAEADFAQVASNALFALVMPVTCLVVGDAVLGAELRSGVFTFTWLSPVAPWKIVLGRWLGGTIAAAGSLAVAFALSALVAGADESARAVALSAAFGAGAYVAVFMAIGCVTRRAAVWSLAFVFLWERLLGAALDGVAQLAPSWQARAAFVDFADGPVDLVREGVPQGTSALARLGLIAAVALVVAAAQLRRIRVSGSSD